MIAELVAERNVQFFSLSPQKHRRGESKIYNHRQFSFRGLGVLCRYRLQFHEFCVGRVIHKGMNISNVHDDVKRGERSRLGGGRARAAGGERREERRSGVELVSPENRINLQKETAVRAEIALVLISPPPPSRFRDEISRYESGWGRSKEAFCRGNRGKQGEGGRICVAATKMHFITTEQLNMGGRTDGRTDGLGESTSSTSTLSAGKNEAGRSKQTHDEAHQEGHIALPPCLPLSLSPSLPPSLDTYTQAIT